MIWAAFAELKLLPFFVRHIYFRMTATPGDVNITAIEKVIPENIGTAVGILFLCAIETK